MIEPTQKKSSGWGSAAFLLIGIFASAIQADVFLCP
jgi:hypothetical protein